MTCTDRDQLEAELSTMTDADVRQAYLATDGRPGAEIADMLAGECERRGLDL